MWRRDYYHTVTLPHNKVTLEKTASSAARFSNQFSSHKVAEEKTTTFYQSWRIISQLEPIKSTHKRVLIDWLNQPEATCVKSFPFIPQTRCHIQFWNHYALFIAADGRRWGPGGGSNTRSAIKSHLLFAHILTVIMPLHDFPTEPDGWEKQKGNKSKMIKKQRKLKTRITHGSESETQYWSGWYWRLCTVLVMPCLSLGWFFFVSFRSNACQRRRSSSAHQSDDGDRSPNNGQVWWLNCIACPSGDRGMPGRCYRACRCPALLWPLMMKRMSQSRAGIDL